MGKVLCKLYSYSDISSAAKSSSLGMKSAVVGATWDFVQNKQVVIAFCSSRHRRYRQGRFRPHHYCIIKFVNDSVKSLNTTRSLVVELSAFKMQ